jgi:hypothetical protein
VIYSARAILPFFPAENDQTCTSTLCATCPETGDALDVLHRGHLGPNPHPGGINCYEMFLCAHSVRLHLTSDTISKSLSRNNPHLGDFLNEAISYLLGVDHIADKNSRQVRQPAQRSDHLSDTTL